MITFYVRKQFKPIVRRFKELISKDPRYKQKRYKVASGLFSVALMDLMTDYVLAKDPKFIEQLAAIRAKENEAAKNSKNNKTTQTTSTADLNLGDENDDDA